MVLQLVVHPHHHHHRVKVIRVATDSYHLLDEDDIRRFHILDKLILIKVYFDISQFAINSGRSCETESSINFPSPFVSSVRDDVFICAKCLQENTTFGGPLKNFITSHAKQVLNLFWKYSLLSSKVIPIHGCCTPSKLGSNMYPAENDIVNFERGLRSIVWY